MTASAVALRLKVTPNPGAMRPVGVRPRMAVEDELDLGRGREGGTQPRDERGGRQRAGGRPPLEGALDVAAVDQDARRAGGGGAGPGPALGKAAAASRDAAV